ATGGRHRVLENGAGPLDRSSQRGVKRPSRTGPYKAFAKATLRPLRPSDHSANVSEARGTSSMAVRAILKSQTLRAALVWGGILAVVTMFFIGRRSEIGQVH